MTDPFDQLLKIWEQTTNDHVAYLDKAKTLSILEIHQYVVKIANQIIQFDELTKDLKASYPAGETTLLTAKYKNKYELYRFLASVLFDLCNSIIAGIDKIESKKPRLDSDIKSEIAHQVRIQVAKALRKKHDTKRAQKPSQVIMAVI